MNEPYIILTSKSFGSFEESVNKAMRDGYVPLGAPFFDNDPVWGAVYQAMIKDSK